MYKNRRSLMDNNIIDAVKKFRKDRNWEQFHNPKDLAISISLEAAELLEIFQWSGSDLEVSEKKQEMQDELADILIYSIMMADSLGLNLENIILNKLEKNNQKYPVEKSFGKKDKYTSL